mgnify:CR=1 FL=1
MISDDRIILGLLALVLGFVFATRDRPGWQRFYVFVPIILVCYLVPSLMTTFGLIDVSESNLWPVAKDYFLPAALFLMTLSIDIKGILGLGSKAIVMFLTATVGIVIGGPLALWIVAQFEPSIIGSGDTAAWRGLATLAGSWIGGGANQTAMLEVYGYPLEGFAALLEEQGEALLASEALRFGVTLQDAVKSVHDDRNVDPLRSDQIRGSRTRGSPG